jgi:membrane-associated phospholipid phosphatase
MRTRIIAALLLAAGSARAQAPERPALFTRQDAVWAAAIIGGSVALSRADLHLIRVWTDSANHDPGRDRVARGFAKLQEGTLTLGNLALWGIGRLTRSQGLADVSFHAAEAVFVGSVAAQLVRGPLGRARPYATNYEDQYEFHPFQGFSNFKYRAFPSIHTSSAFAVATVYTLETNRRNPRATWIVAPVAYALAAGPGLARLYNGQHWASDILAGAFVGTLAGAKVVRYNHDVAPDNRVNRFFLGARNVQVGVDNGAYSARFAMSF